MKRFSRERLTGGIVSAGVWYRTSYGHEVSFNGPRPDGVSEVYERQHPADAPGRTFVPAAPPSEEHPEGIAEYWKDQEPSVWMKNLHANAVRVIQATDPALPRTPEGELPEGAHSYTRHRADPNGNTVFDGEYFYQYDAWNRLVQVNRSGTLSWLRFPYPRERHFVRGEVQISPIRYTATSSVRRACCCARSAMPEIPQWANFVISWKRKHPEPETAASRAEPR